MKKNALLILTLAFCLVLAMVTIHQANRIDALEQQTERQLDSFRDYLDQELQKLSNQMQLELEKANSVVQTFSLEPTGLDGDAELLLVNISLQLKQWHTDTQVTVSMQTDGLVQPVKLEAGPSGEYHGQLRIPLKTGTGLTLEAIISGNETTAKEHLGSWSDLSMLLPLSICGSGWSGPNYVHGAMTTSFHVSVASREGSPGTVLEQSFVIYKNGAACDTVAAVIDPDSFSSDGVSYTTDTQGHFYSLECDPQDVVEIRFCCRDEYGLGYDFLVMTWSADRSLPEGMTGESLILSWEE